MSIIRDEKEILEQLSSAADEITKLGAETGVTSTPTERERATDWPEATRPLKRGLSGVQIVEMAKVEITALTGLALSTVSGLYKDDLGWHVVLDMIELKRIPAASDVLANYDVLLDNAGNLISYHRTRRFYRGTTDAE